jgi:hypothetical protein
MLIGRMISLTPKKTYKGLKDYFLRDKCRIIREELLRTITVEHRSVIKIIYLEILK